MRVEDLSVDYSANQIELNTYALRVDRENAEAFIYGYNKNGKTIKTSIIVASKRSNSLLGDFKKVPKLIIPNKNKSKFKRSKLGEEMDSRSCAIDSHGYVIEFKYIAILDTIFHIENKMEIWEVLCRDGTFNNWKPIAPFERLRNTDDPSILLLRIFEIDRVIQYDDDEVKYYDRIDKLKKTKVVTIKRPILTDEEFFALKIHLIQTLDGIENPGKISKNAFDKIQDLKQEQIRKLSTEVLKNKAHQAPAKPEIKEVFSKQYERNPAVAELAKRMAEGKCQLCGESAPFNNKNNEPYLEVHHIKWLSNGGLDTITNTVALCPNCHRKMHILNLEEDIKILEKQAIFFYINL